MHAHDPLHDIHHYSPTFTIKQLLTLCERKELPITRAMVQNYIREGLLPPPVGRFYTHKHLAALVLIHRLKIFYDIPSIKEALLPFMDGEGLPLEKYIPLSAALDAACAQWNAHVVPDFGESLRLL